MRVMKCVKKKRKKNNSCIVNKGRDHVCNGEMLMNGYKQILLPRNIN